MKVDSEEQRTELLALLSTVTYTVTSGTIDTAKAQIDALHGAIREAGIDEKDEDEEGQEIPNRLEVELESVAENGAQ